MIVLKKQTFVFTFLARKYRHSRLAFQTYRRYRGRLLFLWKSIGNIHSNTVEVLLIYCQYQQPDTNKPIDMETTLVWKTLPKN